jgi:hypothetical protein
MAECPDLPPVDCSAMRLCTVFNNGKAMPLGDGSDGVHRGWLPIEMHRKNRFRPRRQSARNQARIHATRERIDVDEDRDRADAFDGCHSGHRRLRHRHHFIVSRHTDRPQGKRNGIRAARRSHTMPDAEVRGPFVLELVRFRSQYVGT